MKLQTVQINQFRSIEDATLSDCGGFNVIIGKNNAGKSNILLAVDSFFTCIKSGIVTTTPPIGTIIDHHQRSTSKPISISLDFNLNPTELEEIIQDITSVAPQVKNTVEGMYQDPHLRIKISTRTEPIISAFVQQITLHASRPHSISRTILNVSDNAATELIEKAQRAAARESDTKFLEQTLDGMKHFDDDYWQTIKNDFTQGRTYRYDPYQREGSAAIRAKASELAKASSDLATFKERIRLYKKDIVSELTTLKSDPITNRVETLSGHESSIPKYVFNLLDRISGTKVLYLKERRESIGKREAAQLLDLKITRGGLEKFRSVQQLVSALLGVDIDAFSSGSLKSGESAAELDVDQILVQVNGAGIREALRLILDYEFEHPDILLVEEPEIHLHPALETSMMRYLKTIGKESQIFITTHSTNFLDTADMRNVYLASRSTPPRPLHQNTASTTTIQLINMAEAEAAVPRELGIRLSSLFMFDRLVFVEGPSDEEVIREWAAIIGANLGQANVGFIAMGGVRNLAAFAANKTIEFLSRRQVEMWFLLDRDERDETEIQRIVTSVGERAHLFVLEKRELENYLAKPLALTKFLSLKASLAGVQHFTKPSIAEVEGAIAATIEELKSIAIGRRVAKHACVPVVPNRSLLESAPTGQTLRDRVGAILSEQQSALSEREKHLESLIEDQTRIVEQRWSTSKDALVPGDMLLDGVCKRFALRFNKERDAARLASLMERDEICPQIRHLLGEIVR
ncbi:AAA family ATPase [Sorangium sp. So ce136]|uniref:AAA family ATPase n=1 Tax=Sorangium sp. So ce136 TaxID=3133284 RepID=UPI003F109124